MACATPNIVLGRLIGKGFTNPVEHVQQQTKRLTCNPKGFWNAWRRDVLRPQQDWRISPKELVLYAQVKLLDGRKNVRILVDTGAKIPLVFRNNLFPRHSLREASFPVRFSTVDGQPMAGGTHGMFLSFGCRYGMMSA